MTKRAIDKMEKGDYDGVIEDCMEAIALNPKNEADILTEVLTPQIVLDAVK